MNDSATASYRRPGLILALISLPVFIGALDLTIVSAVLPNVITELSIPIQTGGDDAAWVVSGYLLAYTISVALMGRVSDLIGRRRTYFIALLIFILGSWLVAVATLAPAAWVRRIAVMIEGGRPERVYMMALYALIAGRVVQALGAGAMVPVSMALAGDLYPPGRRATALGIVGAIDTAGWVLGHLYGGLMVQVVPWPVLFWINIPITTAVAALTWSRLRGLAETHGEGGLSRPSQVAIWLGVGLINLLAALALTRAMLNLFGGSALDSFANQLLGLRWLSLIVLLVMLAAVVLTIRDSRRVDPSTRPDWLGALLITIALGGLNLGLGGESGALPPGAVIILIISALALGAFIFVQRRAAYPLFNLAYFRERNISVASFINLLIGFCLMVGLVSVPLFVSTVIADSPGEAALLGGVLLGGLTIPMALASIPGGLLTSRFGYRLPTLLGLAIAAAGFFLATTWTKDIARLTIALHMALAGIGLGLTVAPIGAAVIDAVRAAERGIASALVLIMRLIGMTFGASVMTAYSLRRTNALLEERIAAAGSQLDFTQALEITRDTVTQTIAEMLLAAAVICAIALIPAALLRPNQPSEERENP